MRIDSLSRHTFLTPESAVKTLLLTPMPASSHFPWFTFIPENKENSSKVLLLVLLNYGKRRSNYAKEEGHNLCEKLNEKKYCIIKSSFPHKLVRHLSGHMVFREIESVISFI